MNTFFKYNAYISRVVDGDTVDAIVDLGFSVKMAIRFRLTGFDAPETYRPKSEDERAAGELATKALESMVLHKNIIVHSNKHGKYRYLGELFLGDGNVSVNDMMVSLGHTKEKFNEEASKNKTPI